MAMYRLYKMWNAPNMKYMSVVSETLWVSHTEEDGGAALVDAAPSGVDGVIPEHERQDTDENEVSGRCAD